MSEEQKLILNMLAEGKISVEEAQRLLDNLGQRPPNSGFSHDKKKEPPMSIMDNIVETLRSGLSGISFGFGDLNRIVLEDYHTGSFSSRPVELDLDVLNGSVRVEPSDDQLFHLQVVKRVRAATREQAEEMIADCIFAEFDGGYLKAGDTDCRGLRNRVSISLHLRLPMNHVYSGTIRSKNGSLEVNGIDVKGITLHTVNGAVRTAKVTGAEIVTGTVNGSISLEGSLEQVEAETTNGSISLVSMAEDSRIRLKTVNGRIQVRLPAREDIGYLVDARATSGNVRLDHAFLAGKFTAERFGGGRRIEGTTGNWNQAQHKIEMYLRSVNGSIGINELE